MTIGNGRRALCAAVILLALAGFVEGRQWTDLQGRKVDATFVRLDGETVVLQQGLKVLRIGLGTLCEEDQEFIRQKTGGKKPIDAPPATPMPPATPVAPGVVPKPAEPASLEADRTWTDNLGRQVKGRFVRMLGPAMVELSIAGKPTVLQVSRLSDPDQEFLRAHGATAADNQPIQPIKPSLPARGPLAYPAEVTVGVPTALDDPRWRLARDRMVYGSLSRISVYSAEVVCAGTAPFGPLKLADLSANDRDYVLGLLQKAGQQGLIDRIRQSNSAIFPNAAPPMAAPSPPSQTREWHQGWERFAGYLVEVNEREATVLDSSSKHRRLSLADLIVDDREFVLALLAECKADSLAAYVRYASDQSSPHRVPTTEGEVKIWTIRGQATEAQVVLFAREGIELRDVAGKVHRVAYKDLSNAEVLYLSKFVSSRPELSVAAHFFSDRVSAAMPPPPAPVFVPPPQAAAPPPAPAPSSFGSGIRCGNCNTMVPSHLGVGDRCPRCGVTFTGVRGGGGSSAYEMGRMAGRITGIVLLVLGVLWGLTRLAGGSGSNS